MPDNCVIVLKSQFDRYAKTLSSSKRYVRNWEIVDMTVVIHGRDEIILSSDKVDINGQVTMLSNICRVKWMPEIKCDSESKNDNYGFVELWFKNSDTIIFDIGQSSFPFMQYIKWYLQYGDRSNESVT